VELRNNGKVLAAIIIVAVLLLAASAVVLMGNTSAKEKPVAMKLVWLDQQQYYGYDQVTELAESNGKIFASAKGVSNDGKDLFSVKGYDGTNGSVLWTTNINLGEDWNIASKVAVENDMVVAVGWGETEDVYQTILVGCFNASSGAEIWRQTFDAGGAENTAYGVTIYDGLVYVAGSGADSSGDMKFLVLAYNLVAGNLVWEKRIGTSAEFNRAQAIVADANGVFVTGFVMDKDWNKVMLLTNLNLKTGEEKWSVTYNAGQGESEGDYLVVEKGLAVVAGKGRVGSDRMAFVRAYDVRFGNLIWSKQMTVASGPTHLVVSGNTLLLTGLYEGYYFLESMNLFTGSQNWFTKVTNLGRLNFNSAVDVEGSMVVASFYSQNFSEENDYIWSIDVCQYSLSSGELVQSYHTEGLGDTYEDVDVLIHGGKAYFTTATEKEAPLALAMAAIPSTPLVKFDGYNMTVNGEPFVIKGINYSPSPINSVTYDWPWGDYFQDGADDFSKFKEIQDRDIPLLKAMGVNCIKVYSMTGFFWSDEFDRAHLKHEHFYNALAEAGIYVVVQVDTTSTVIKNYNDDIWINGTHKMEKNDLGKTERCCAQWQVVINEAKDYPAVIGYCLGNEWIGDFKASDTESFKKANAMLGQVKKLDKDRFTTISCGDGQVLVDNGDVTEKYESPMYYQDKTMTNLDVWGVNPYRGTLNTGYDDLFCKIYTNKQYTSTKPLLLTEWGCPFTTQANGKLQELSTAQEANAVTYLKSHWNASNVKDSIVDNLAINGGVCIGGFLFEFSDEWWKADNDVHGQPWQWDAYNQKNINFPGGYWEEEGHGFYKISVGSDNVNVKWQFRGSIDALTPRTTVIKLVTEMYSGEL
jgi:hypothetical protein